MTTIVNENLLKNFIIKSVGSTMTLNEAQKLGIEDEYQELAEEKDTNILDFNEIVQDSDLYEQFATLYVTDKEQKAQAKDKEQEKEEQIAVTSKNEAGI